MSDRTLNTTRKSLLLRSILARRCVLFLGPGAAAAPSGRTIEQELVERVIPVCGLPAGEPLPDKLGHLCQLAGSERLRDIREKVAEYFAELKAANWTTAAHTIFARMHFPLIIQLTPDPLMVTAIEKEHGTCATGCYDFRYDPRRPAQSLTDCTADAEHSPPGRVVYGLRGLWTAPRTIPLSTDEDISHLVALVRESPKMPEELSARLRTSGGADQPSALFVGFDFGDWRTRMLLRGVFAADAVTLNMPEPAVASQPREPAPAAAPTFAGPSAEDREFLWSCFRLIFTDEAPESFAATLEAEIGKQPRAARRRRIDQRALLNFLSKVLPEDDLTNLGAVIPEFMTHTGRNNWEQDKRSSKARNLLGWMQEHDRLDELVESIAEEVPQLFEELGKSLYQT